MKPSQIRQVLSERGIRLTKSLGQNLLHDGQQLRRIVEAIDPQPGERVLEIGPGLGALTACLLESGVQVLAIEMDARLVEYLRHRFGACPNLELVEADALVYLRAHPTDWSGWKLGSNLPYSVASPLLVELALGAAPPQRIAVTVQWEVAQRLAAAAGDPDYGLLTVLIQLNYAVAGRFKIPPSCFFPVPDVDSACVTLVRRSPRLPNPESRSAFVRIVRRGFAQRRKMLLKLLRQEWPTALLEAAFNELGLDASVRAEAVTVEQFVALTLHLTGDLKEGL